MHAAQTKPVDFSTWVNVYLGDGCVKKFSVIFTHEDAGAMGELGLVSPMSNQQFKLMVAECSSLASRPALAL